MADLRKYLTSKLGGPHADLQDIVCVYGEPTVEMAGHKNYFEPKKWRPYSDHLLPSPINIGTVPGYPIQPG